MKARTLSTLLLCALCCTLFHTLTAQPFNNPLPIPYLLTGEEFTLEVQESTHNFDPNGTVTEVDLDTALHANCYNAPGRSEMSYLGPVMAWNIGDSIDVNMVNMLSSDSTTSHWHGLNIPARFDGGPHQSFAPGANFNPDFRLIDPVQTLWYHSHLMNFTTEQVILGQAGLIIVQDPQNDPYYQQMPHDYGVNDIPLVIQEKGFEFDTIGSDIKAKGMIVSEKPGNGPYTLLNGVVNAFQHVPAQFVRMRFLNGSPRKSFHLGISEVLSNPQGDDFGTIFLIATDGGYTAEPYRLDSFLISPGERYEMIFDFGDYDHGDTLYLSNLVRSVPRDIITGGRTPPPPGTPGDAFMAFVVDTSIHPTDPILSRPFALKPYFIDTSRVFRHRTKVLMGGANTGGMWTIDGTPMDRKVINDTVLVNTTEKWTIHNTTDISHPFHIHKVQFQLIEYIGNAGVDSDDSVRYVYPDMPEYMLGYKDMILVRAGARATFVARFDSFPDTEIRADRGFMYHCHILTHEDFSMMHQFVVVDSAAYYGAVPTVDLGPEASFRIFPNPASDVLYFKGRSDKPARIRFVDMSGRVLMDMPVPPFEAGISIPVADLPRGMTLLVWETEEGRQFSRKILLE